MVVFSCVFFYFLSDTSKTHLHVSVARPFWLSYSLIDGDDSMPAGLVCVCKCPNTYEDMLIYLKEKKLPNASNLKLYYCLKSDGSVSSRCLVNSEETYNEFIRFYTDVIVQQDRRYTLTQLLVYIPTLEAPIWDSPSRAHLALAAAKALLPHHFK